MQDVQAKAKRYQRVYAQGSVKDYTARAFMLLAVAVIIPPVGLWMSGYYLLQALDIQAKTGNTQKGVWLLYIALFVNVVITGLVFFYLGGALFPNLFFFRTAI